MLGRTCGPMKRLISLDKRCERSFGCSINSGRNERRRTPYIRVGCSLLPI